MQRCLECTGMTSQGATRQQAKHGTVVCGPYSTPGLTVFTLTGAGYSCPKFNQAPADVVARRIEWMGRK